MRSSPQPIPVGVLKSTSYQYGHYFTFEYSAELNTSGLYMNCFVLIYTIFILFLPTLTDDLDQIDMANTTFWREWKSKLEEEKQLADQARMLKQILPDIDTSRFLSGDVNYIKRVVYSFVGSVKLEKKHILKEAVRIAETYGLQRTEVSLTHLSLYFCFL